VSFALFLTSAAGVACPAPASTWEFVGLAVRELAFGTTLGLVAALPFDGARIGGKLIDLFRGSSAEAVLPMTGSKESAFGDGLYQLLVALCSIGVAMPLTLSALFRSFLLVPLGTFAHTEAVVEQVVRLVATAFGTALALGAPVAGVSLAVDSALGLASRAAPQLNLQESGAPVRILAGGALLWLSIGVCAERLLAAATATPEVFRNLLQARP
jgi:flagellar biosynthetic protein FliR/type III secretion protein T